MKTEQFQGLKLLFVLSIVFMHAGMPILGEGADLCSFFFVISGFFYKGETCVRYRDYMWNKISSMLPLQWMSVILAVVVLHLSVHWDIIPHLLLLQSYIPEKGFEFFNYNGVAWFLSSLMFCYALSPVVYKVILKIKDKKLFLILLFFIIWALCKFVSGEYATWFIYVSPVFRLVEYSIGVTLRQIANNSNRIFVKNIYANIIIICVYLLFLRYRVFGNTSAILHSLFIFYFYLNVETCLTRLFSLKAIVFLAKYCIYIYMLHCIFLSLYSHCGILKVPLAILSALCFGMVYEHIYNKVRCR